MQVIQNDVIKCCKMMSSNVAKWCHHIATSQQRGEIVFHVVIFSNSLLLPYMRIANALFQRLICVIELSVKYFETRMHSSGMLTVRCSGRLGEGVCLRGLSAQGVSARGWTEWQTRVKILPCWNYVADSNKLPYNICKMVMILGYTFRCLLHRKRHHFTRDMTQIFIFQKECNSLVTVLSLSNILIFRSKIIYPALIICDKLNQNIVG